MFANNFNSAPLFWFLQRAHYNLYSVASNLHQMVFPLWGVPGYMFGAYFV